MASMAYGQQPQAPPDSVFDVSTVRGAEAALCGSELLHFSELFEHSGGIVQWSPDGLCMATARKNRLVIRDVHTLEILQLYTCLDGSCSETWRGG